MTPPSALVTGASGGIGLQIARQFAEQGWNVFIGARDAGRGAEAAAQVVGGQPLRLDVRNADTIASAASAIPKLDVLVNNAGISLDTVARVTEVDVEVFRRTYETNVFGVVAVTNALLPGLRHSAHPRIVNLSNGTGSLGWSPGSFRTSIKATTSTERPRPTSPSTHRVAKRGEALADPQPYP